MPLRTYLVAELEIPRPHGPLVSTMAEVLSGDWCYPCHNGLMQPTIFGCEQRVVILTVLFYLVRRISR